LATFFFAYQIYCDFSGYSDIAIGSARLMGFDLMKNFNQPYLSKSIPEFWRRWHISLSTWFRDYLYIPLGGSRVSISRWYINIMIVFVVSGLWHGANWTFVIWGALHGTYMILSFVLGRYLSKILPHPESPLPAFLFQLTNILVTFLLVNFAWIFFRANSLADAFYIITHLFVDFTLDLSFGVGFGKTTAIITILCIIFMESVDLIHRNKWLNFDFSVQPVWMRWSFYYVVIMFIMLFGNMDTTAQFIYFQF
jgi:D-alanyl-lipoteichoic acid acyltransferase DltB (MBOAT superfamily)